MRPIAAALLLWLLAGLACDQPASHQGPLGPLADSVLGSAGAVQCDTSPVIPRVEGIEAPILMCQAASGDTSVSLLVDHNQRVVSLSRRWSPASSRDAYEQLLVTNRGRFGPGIPPCAEADVEEGALWKQGEHHLIAFHTSATGTVGLIHELNSATCPPPGS